ncbi:MAG: EF-hand domain-containing protein [Geminicoccaceae bacterium]
MQIESIPRVRDLVPSLGLALAIATGAAHHAWAQATSPKPDVSYTSEEIAFFAADTDGDGLVSEAELARDTARGFATLDKDGSRTLKPEELGPHDAAQFKRVDTNGDGVLTFKEVMVNKSRAFKEGDKNQDGALSFEEMVGIVEIEIGGAS